MNAHRSGRLWLATIAVGLASLGLAGCEGNATKYLQASEEVKVEEEKLAQLEGLRAANIGLISTYREILVARADSIGQEAKSKLFDILRDNSLSETEKEAKTKALQDSSKKLAEEAAAECTAHVEKTKSILDDINVRIKAQSEVVKTIRARRDALAPSK